MPRRYDEKPLTMADLEAMAEKCSNWGRVDSFLSIGARRTAVRAGAHAPANIQHAADGATMSLPITGAVGSPIIPIALK